MFNVPVDLKKAYDSEGKEVFKHFSKVIMLVIIDEDWKEHLREMDDLRQSVRNASYEQKDPLLIYKFESYNLFSKMLEKGNREILSTLFKAFVPVKENPDVTKQQMPQPKTDLSQLQTSRNEAAAAAGSRGEKQACSRACREEGGTKRSVPLRQREEIQTLPRQDRSLSALPYYEQRRSPMGSSVLLYGRIGKFSRKTGGTLQKGPPVFEVCFVIACPIKIV